MVQLSFFLKFGLMLLTTLLYWIMTTIGVPEIYDNFDTSLYGRWVELGYVKVQLTPNIIVGMCNIWVILRWNVIYLYSKKPHLDQLFHCQSSRYDVIRWIFGTKNKGKLICKSPNDIISGNFDSEKVDQDGTIYYKDLKYSLIIQEQNTKKNHERVVVLYVIKNHVNLHKL
jgi:hypothetical protein